MKLTKKKINKLIKTKRVDGMPKGTYVAGFDDYAGGHYPLYLLGDYYMVEDCEFELYTHLTRTIHGVEFYLRFI